MFEMSTLVFVTVSLLCLNQASVVLADLRNCDCTCNGEKICLAVEALQVHYLAIHRQIVLDLDRRMEAKARAIVDDAAREVNRRLESLEMSLREERSRREKLEEGMLQERQRRTNATEETRKRLADLESASATQRSDAKLLMTMLKEIRGTLIGVANNVVLLVASVIQLLTSRAEDSQLFGFQLDTELRAFNQLINRDVKRLLCSDELSNHPNISRDELPSNIGREDETDDSWNLGVDQMKPSRKACRLPVDRGHCRNSTEKFHFDPKDGGCLSFAYGGCDDIGNVFHSKEDCDKACVIPDESDVCSLPALKGPCCGDFSRWHYDAKQDDCFEFSFSGCQGNANRFDTRESCRQRCKKEPTEQTPFLSDFCSLPQDPGPCSGSELLWSYDSGERLCNEFRYGGCRGNRNRFESRRKCEDSCFKEQEACRLPKDPGPCTDFTKKYHFDLKKGRCTEFSYGGCDGNGNRFDSLEDCRDVCVQPIPSACKLPNDPGPCTDFTRKYHYDLKSRRCYGFSYGGCDGNGNRFDSLDDCWDVCVYSKGPGVCRLPALDHDCGHNLTRWYYDFTRDDCFKYRHGGCGRNWNNFGSREHCQKLCQKEPKGQTDVASDVCDLAVDRGPCRESWERWFYNSSDNRCDVFHFGGCNGNGNNFLSRSDCENRCVKKT